MGDIVYRLLHRSYHSNVYFSLPLKGWSINYRYCTQ